MNYSKESLSLVYITSVFPALSHTFIHREVRGLRASGVKIKSYSVHRPPADTISADDSELMDDTFYVFPLDIIRFIWSHLYYFCKAPAKYLEILLFVLTRRETKLGDRVRCFFHFCEAIYVARRVERDNIKHIHAHFAGGSATCAMIISKLLGINFSFTAHGTALLIERVLLKEKIESAEFIIAISNYNKNFILDIVPESIHKIYVVHCGVDPAEFAPCPFKTDVITILSVGRLDPVKGHSILIEACNLLHKSGFQFHCIIIGEGPERQRLEQLIRKYKLDDFVELKGAVFQSEIQQYYDQADIFVLPSIRETMGVVLMEAMAKETPVIAPRVMGVPELVKHMETGVLTSPTDVRQLADAIALLINNYDLRIKLGRKGRKKVIQEFNINDSVASLKSIFEHYLVDSEG